MHIGDGDNLPLKPPENYLLDYDKGLLTLHFTLPLDKPLDTHKQPIADIRQCRWDVRKVP